MKVEKWDEHKEGPLTEEALRKKIESRGYQVSKYVYSPGTFFPDHMHAVDKIDAVLSGRFKMSTPSGIVILEAGDLLEVPSGTVHRAEVVGEESVVSLDAIKG